MVMKLLTKSEACDRLAVCDRAFIEIGKPMFTQYRSSKNPELYSIDELDGLRDDFERKYLQWRTELKLAK